MERLIRWLSKLPIDWHYWVADWLIYPLCFYVVRYRRKLVEKNLRLSFPEKSDLERKNVEKDFYHHLSYLMVEVVYGYGLSAEEMLQHVLIENHELIVRMVEEYGGAIVMLGHIGNWEWLADYNQHLQRDGIMQANIYRKQTNSIMNALMNTIRNKFGGILIEKQTILRQMLLLRKEGKKVAYGLISDQKPRPNVTRFWTEFLHQETGFLDGGEVLGKKFRYPVAYGHITRKGRGVYVFRFELLSEHPENMEENEITRMFAERLEQNIQEQPAIWLWTHNRWKWGRPPKE